MKNNKMVPIILVSGLIVLIGIVVALSMDINNFKNSSNSDNKENKTNQVIEKHETNNTESNNVDVSDNVNKDNKIESDNKVNNNSDNKNNETVVDNNSVDTTTNTTTNNSNSNSSSDSPNSIDSNETVKNENVENTPVISYTEDDVVAYFKNEDNKIGVNQDDKTVREKVKESFITVVDFIFYDKEIKGYTFKELTTKAKLEVIEIALSIDNKIDKHFPNYKDKIKDKYSNIKGKLATKYLEFTSSLCDSVGVNVCEQAKEDFNTMKESFGFTWELIKELASSGSSKIKEFYESWRDSK